MWVGLFRSGYYAIPFAALLMAAPTVRADDAMKPMLGGGVYQPLKEASDDREGLAQSDEGKCRHTLEEPCIDRTTIRDLQVSLNAFGYYAGPIDGIFGPQTSSALNAFRKSKGIDEIGNFVHLNVAQAIIRAAAEGQTGNGLVPQKPAARSSPATGGSTPPVPTRVFSGPNQFPPAGFRGYGFMAFPAQASEYDLDRHLLLCQAYMNSLPESSSVKQPRRDQFVTVWPLKDKHLATWLNQDPTMSEVSHFCGMAIEAYDVAQAREVIANVRANKNTLLDGRGPYLFGWIPADEFGKSPKLILMLDFSRVTTYEQALVQMQSWQQKIATNPELLRDGFSIENMRRIVRDWADQHGQAFLVLIGAA